MLDLTIRQLDRDDLDSAWPLISIRSGWSLAGWRRFADHLFERGGGIIGIAAGDGCLHGLATYEPVTKKRAGRVLKVDTLVAFEFSRRAPVRQALCNALAGFARLFDCEAVSVAMPNRGYVEYAAKDVSSAAQSDAKAAAD